MFSAMLASCVVSAFLWGLSDFLSQLLEHLSKENPLSHFFKKINVVRIIRIVLFGSIVFAPLAYVWFDFLVSTFPGSELKDAIIRMLCDQLMFAPLILSTLFVVLTLLEGLPLSSALLKVQNSLWSTLKLNWCYWPFVQTFNMWVVPADSRLLFVNCASIPWNMFLSWKASQPAPSQGAGDAKLPGIV